MLLIINLDFSYILQKIVGSKHSHSIIYMGVRKTNVHANYPNQWGQHSTCNTLNQSQIKFIYSPWKTTITKKSTQQLLSSKYDLSIESFVSHTVITVANHCIKSLLVMLFAKFTSVLALGGRTSIK